MHPHSIPAARTHRIDFFELPVFHNASTDAGITLLLNLRPQRETKYFPILSLENLDLESITNGNYQLTIKLETEWQFVDKEELSILNKIDTDTVSLADFANNRIYRGITTGLNSTFILSSETRTKILNRCKTQEEREKTNAIIKIGTMFGLLIGMTRSRKYEARRGYNEIRRSID